jgi:hypothetical protein
MLFDLFERLVVFSFVANWTDHFLRHDTVSGSTPPGRRAINSDRSAGNPAS